MIASERYSSQFYLIGFKTMLAQYNTRVGKPRPYSGLVARFPRPDVRGSATKSIKMRLPRAPLIVDCPVRSLYRSSFGRPPPSFESCWSPSSQNPRA